MAPPPSPTDAKPFKPLQTILAQEMEQAESEFTRPARGLLLSGLLAGIGVSFSMLLIAALTTSLQEAPDWLLEILIANAYTVGFILVIVARTDLFTEYTTIAILPILDGRNSVRSLGRLWGLVYVGNLFGTAVVAGATVIVGPALGVAEAWSFGEIARRLVEPSWWVMLLSGLLAGWLMGLLSWLVTAGRETISQFFLIWLVTGLIGYTHLHHSILGAAEVLAGVLTASDVSAHHYAGFLLWSTLGNAVGGIAFAWMMHHSALLGAAQPSRGQSGRKGSPRDEPSRAG